MDLRATVRVLNPGQGHWSMNINKVHELHFFEVVPDRRGLHPVIDALEQFDKYDKYANLSRVAGGGASHLMKKIANDIITQHYPDVQPDQARRGPTAPWSGAAATKDYQAVSRMVHSILGHVIDDGTQHFDDGTKRLADGTWCFKDGTKRSPDGAMHFRDGTTRCADGTWEFDDWTFRCIDGVWTFSDGYRRDFSGRWYTEKEVIEEYDPRDPEADEPYDPLGDNDKEWPTDEDGNLLPDHAVVHQ
ncbi:MAG: hypothetical protein M1831_005966 [Alyxoria varia]|nr:MAG: hypothetical protein M1831_005966 [Alyxoria varia]